MSNALEEIRKLEERMEEDFTAIRKEHTKITEDTEAVIAAYREHRDALREIAKLPSTKFYWRC